jgi:hypothetical protein
MSPLDSNPSLKKLRQTTSNQDMVVLNNKEELLFDDLILESHEVDLKALS